MSFISTNLGKSFLGSTAIPVFPSYSGAPVNPIEMPTTSWAVRNSTTNNNFEIEVFDLPEGVDFIDVRAGSVNEPWEQIPLTGVGIYVNPYPVPTGIAIKVWMRLRNSLGGYSITSYSKEVVVTNTANPTISVGQIGVNVTGLSVPWSTDTAQGTGYVLVDQNPTRTGPQVESGGGAYSGFLPVSATGGQTPFTPSGLTADTSYYVHVVHVDGSRYSTVHSEQITTLETPSGIVVTTAAEVYAAISAGHRNLLIPDQECGSDWRHLMQSSPIKDFTNDRLTIQAQDPNNKPVFMSANQNLKGCHGITFRNIICENAGNLNKTHPGWWFDGEVNGNISDSASGITIEFCEQEDDLPAGLTDTTKDENWGFPLVRWTRFRNQYSHSNKIRYNKIKICFECCNGFNISGDSEIIGNTVDHWYFDGWRLLGCPLSTWVEGNLIAAYNYMGQCVGRYEEGPEPREPHPDVFQIFQSASAPNKAARNVLFYQNVFANGNLRGINIQAGLTESILDNVGYVENLWCPRNNTHGHTIGNGAEGVLFERQSCMYSGLGGGATNIRIYYSNGQVLLKDTIYDTITYLAERPNDDGFELDIVNSPAGVDYSNFVGPGNPTTEAAAMSAFRLISDTGRGALTTSGQFRNLPHVPLKAKAPSLTALGGGQVRIDTIRASTLMSPKQVAQGGTTYTRRDIRWSASGDAGTWTTVNDVEQGDVIGVSTGAKYFQTRLWNSSGYGLWSEKLQLTVS